MQTPSVQRPNASLSRPKAQLACNLCKTKKIKCDRQQPCSNCRMKPAGSCVYPRNGPSDKYDSTNRDSHSMAVRMGDRIDRLEKALSAMAEAANTSVSASSTQRPPAERHAYFVQNSAPQLHSVGSERRFINPSHWETILNDIAGIKSELLASQNDESKSSTSEHGNFYLLSGVNGDVATSELLGSIPSQSSVEALIDLLAGDSNNTSVLTVLHVPTLRKECLEFWQDPSAVSFSWLALLFSVMALSIVSALRNGTNIEGFAVPDATARLYTLRAAQCLIKSDYSKPTDHTIKAMILYMACEHRRDRDWEFRASLVLGTIVRLAISLGYHRDPRHFPNMTILESEMRRRTWAKILELDLVLAEKCGLPRLINDHQADTLLPTNILDEDLSDDLEENPPIQPDSEPTSIGYLCYKTKLLKVQGKIFDLVNSPSEMPYSNFLQLDKALEQEVTCKPAWLQVQDVRSPNLPLFRRKQAIELDIIAHRARMVLHRKYLLPGRSNPRYEFSRDVCLESSQRVLQHQREVTEQLLSTGDSDWRFMSIMGHHFLLAAMFLCLDLSQGLPSREATEVEWREYTNERLSKKATQLQKLQESYELWTKARSLGGFADKAARAVKIMLERLHQSPKPVEKAQSVVDSTLLSQQEPEPLDVRYQNAPSAAANNANQILQSDRSGVDYPVGNGSMDFPSASHWSNTNIEDFDENLLNVQNVLDNSLMDIDWSAWDAEYLTPAWNGT